MSARDRVRTGMREGASIGLDRVAQLILSEGNAVIADDAIDEGTLLGSGETEAPEQLARVVKWTAAHAAFVHFGTRPHWPPFRPIYEWVRRNLGRIGQFVGFKLPEGRRVTNEEILRSVARAVQAKIAARGTDPVPFATIAIQKTAPRVNDIMAEEIRRRLERI